MEDVKTYPVPDEKVYSFNEIDESLTYSYAHYLNWLFEERLELIKGKIFKMSPGPARLHQKVLSNLLNLSSIFYMANLAMFMLHLLMCVSQKKAKPTKIFTPYYSLICA